MSRCFSAFVGAAVLAIAEAGGAQAEPVYAYGDLNFQNFSLTGVVTPTGNVASTITSLTTIITSTDTASYPGSATGGNTVGGNWVSGTDAAQATSGPGPFPSENTFSQALLPALSPVPAGTRADVQDSGPQTGATINLAAEGKLPAAGNATSSAGTSTTLSFTTTGPTTINLTFSASSELATQVALSGDSASAQVEWQFRIYDSTLNRYVTIADNIDPADSSTFIAPFGLNTNVATMNPSGPQSFSSPLTSYSYSASLTSGDTFQLTLADSASEILQGVTPVAVSEPLSIALFGSGLLTLGFFRFRRKS